MTASARLLAISIHGLEALFPDLAARLALRLFSTTGPRMALRDVDRATHEEARQERIRRRGTDVRVYRWGRSERAVLLLHGWQGRASQFAPLVRELVAEGFRVVAFDAPAHGGSGGRRADIRDWVDLADRLERTDGPFDAFVGHSFGGLAALTAARHGASVPRVAVIASAASPAAFLAEFARALRLGPAVTARFEQHNRVLQADPVLDAVLDLLRAPREAGASGESAGRDGASTSALNAH